MILSRLAPAGVPPRRPGDLGLAGLNPPPAVASLTFKTSPPRIPDPTGIPADSLQIVQDTGSGGSSPVSTDRTAWALGAERTLANLDRPERTRFARTALAALRGTLEADRIAAFDLRETTPLPGATTPGPQTCATTSEPPSGTPAQASSSPV